MLSQSNLIYASGGMDGQVTTDHTATMTNIQAIMIIEIIRTNLEMSFSIGVGVGLSSLDSFAI